MTVLLFSHFAVSLSRQVWTRIAGCFLKPALKGTVSPKLVDTIRFYRQHKVSGLQLVANYCQFNKHRTQIEDAWLVVCLYVCMM